MLTPDTRGKIGMSVTGREELGIPDLAIEAGTLMPGIAAHMRFDEKTTFAQATAQLTGLKPLEDLGRRSARIVRRLRNDETKAAQSGAQTKLTEFKEKRQNIVDAWSAQPDLGKPAELTAPDQPKKVDKEEDASKKSIADARKLLEEKKQTLESTAEKILGTALQLASDDEVSTLLQQLGKAADLLKPSSLAALPSVAVIKNLRAVSDDDCEAAETLIDDMVKRAMAVVDRLRNKQEAARWQLYAKVAAWHAEHHQSTELKDCPVCGTDLEKVPPDALLDKAVKEALVHCSQADADAAKGAQEWERDAARELLDGLPDCLRAFADNAPPDNLLSIYHKAYVEQLLVDRAFANRLSPLKQNAGRVWELAIKENKLPGAPAPQAVDLPEDFKNGRLAQRIGYIVKAIMLSKHRAESTDSIKALVERYIGAAESTEAEDGEVAANERPLRDQIEAVRMCVKNTAPIVSILRQLDDLEKTRKDYVALVARLALIEQAANALEAFAGFEGLVYQQVSGLIQALDADTRNWLGTIYSPHYRGGPTYSGIDLGEETGLGLRAAIGGMQVPAYKIMNASLLRACVWAFVFSLWDRVKARLGGLDCMLLDDPQTHFDPINAENLAAAIPQMPGHGMRPLITSNDNRFVASIRDTLPDRSTASPTWHAWTLNPISSSRLTAGVSPAVEEIFERLQEWQDDENNAAKAQQFVSTVRLYVENRLWDLLATDPMIMHKPTLADLIQSVRSAHNNGEPPFEEPPFQALLSRGALRDNAPFYKIINKAHHRLHEVTPHEAGEVAEPFKEIDRLLRSCSTSYARFMGRLTREDRDLFLADLPPAPAQTALNRGPVRLLGDVSARSSADVEADMQAGQVFDLDGLGAVALYGVRSPGLGALALQGQVVVASLESEARDGNPVVALSGDKIYLRRLLGDRRDPSRVVLACDQTGTERVPPTLMLPRASISRPSNLADRKGAPTRLRGIGKPQVERYFNEMRSRVGQVPREIPTVTEAYDRLVTVTASLDGRSEYPAGYDPSVLGLPGQLRHYWLYQHGGELKAASLSRGSFLAEIETSRDDLAVWPAGFWKSGAPPSWASDYGADDFGPWAEIAVMGAGGVPVIQRMRWIAPGSFLMGSPEDEEGRWGESEDGGRWNEGPQHQVTLTKGYWLFNTPVTQELWVGVMGENASQFSDPERPVEQVTWDDAMGFLEKLNALVPGLELALPTEAQWEYACRSGTTTPNYAGDEEVLNEIAWYFENSASQTHLVKLKRPNSWGLYDMLGNVWEWCADDLRRYSGEPLADPVGTPESARRALRGGSWDGTARDVRAASRSADYRDDRIFNIGFRCARVRAGAEPAEPGLGRAERQPAPDRHGGARLLSPHGGRGAPSVDLPNGRGFIVRSDREILTFTQVERPEWANAMDRDRYGLWAAFTLGEVVQRMRWIAPGRFMMGSPDDEPGRSGEDSSRNEGPCHDVRLTKGYWLFDTPVTQALWIEIMGENPSRFVDPKRPVEQASWDEAARFMETINAFVPGLDLALPTEAQWEYACRAGTEAATYAGPIEILGDYNAPVLEAIAWYGGNSGVNFELEKGYDSSGWPEKQYEHSHVGARPVRQKAPNAWGLYDMLGNVWEWCADDLRPYDASPVADPVGSLVSAQRGLRGGSWLDDARLVRAASRVALPRVNRYSLTGFRCARVRE